MKIATAMALILLASGAHAVNGGGGNGTGNGGSVSGSSSVSGSESVSSATSDSSSSATGGSATAMGGNAEATGGSASGGESIVSVREDYDPPAPSVTVVPPLSTMTCIRGFGVGASSQEGAIALGPTWRDRDCQSAELFRTLSSIGLYVPAAVALCSRERHWSPFGSRDACEAQVAQALIDAATPQESVRMVYWPEDTQCRESLKRCEEVTK